MTTIHYNPAIHSFDNNIIKVKGTDVKFDSNYKVISQKGGEKVFDFKESTGSEWDPKTIWKYKSEDGMELHVGNEDVTPQHEKAYLEHKMRK